MTITNKKIVKRWDKVMYSIGCEHLTINTEFSELEDCKEYHGLTNGIWLSWMLNEAKYWLSCYYESGNVRCDDRFIDKENNLMVTKRTRFPGCASGKEPTCQCRRLKRC